MEPGRGASFVVGFDVSLNNIEVNSAVRALAGGRMAEKCGGDTVSCTDIDVLRDQVLPCAPNPERPPPPPIAGRGQLCQSQPPQAQGESGPLHRQFFLPSRDPKDSAMQLLNPEQNIQPQENKTSGGSFMYFALFDPKGLDQGFFH